MVARGDTALKFNLIKDRLKDYVPDQNYFAQTRSVLNHENKP